MSNTHRTALPLRDFIPGQNGMGFVANAVRQSMIFNAYEGKTIFSAVVLTTPVVLSELDINYNGPTSATADRVSEFMFKGRIIGEDGIPSPHDYLPDPCNIDGVGNLERTMNIISLHTTFFSATQQETQDGVSKPKVGDIVRVELERNVFSYNLATGVFLEVTTDSALSVRTQRNEETGTAEQVDGTFDRSECRNLSELFDNYNTQCSRTNISTGGCFGEGFFNGTGLSSTGGNGTTPSFPYILTAEESDHVVTPTRGVLTSPYGPRVHPIHNDVRQHHGIDIAAGTTQSSNKADVVAIAAGRVTFARDQGNNPGPTTGGGNTVKIVHDVEGAPARLHSSRYLHLHTVDVSVGDTVTAGQKIGSQGTTGGSTGDHLHFEVKYDGGVLGDPIQLLGWNPCAITGIRSGTMQPNQKCRS